MTRPQKLEDGQIQAWLSNHPGWSRRSGAGLVRVFGAKDFAGALGFAVRVGMVAEKTDHHPDLEVSWGRASAHWNTHDAGGVTALDLELADATDSIAKELGLGDPKK